MADVLIVDDSLTVRMDLADAFEAAGFRTRPCGTLTEARAALARDKIALAVLDVILPDGDGVELLREIRAQHATAIKVVMLSTEAAVKDRIRALHIGADDYVGKPYDPQYLVARARELLAQSATPALARATVLVIDDSQTFRAALADALQAEGYAALLASSGEEGLRIAAANRPAAILIDGILPGLDGATVIRKIRLDEALRRTPCLLLTGSTDHDSELRALDAGADAFVRKEDDMEVVLARLAAILRAAAPERVETASLFGPKRVLAVDDSPTYQQELAERLRGDGYEVILARSGEEGIDMLAMQSVDCILLDLTMPGIGGRETLRRVKDSPVFSDIPLIVLTAADNRLSMLETLGLGADDFVTKSSEFDVLSVRVRAQMRRKQIEQEHRRLREQLLRGELQAADERAARQVAETRASLVGELQRKNRELEAFSYSVSHDLRAPLRALDGFSRMLLDEYAAGLDDRGQAYIRRIQAASQRMGELIDDLLKLSRQTGGELRREPVDLSEMVASVCAELEAGSPDRKVRFSIEPGLFANVDGRLMRLVFENLLGNAWKFTARVAAPHIVFGVESSPGGDVYFVRDNGAGFDMRYSQTLFAPFRRLHGKEFPGTGIGLATVQRIVDRHDGRVWAHGEVDRGATVYFTLPSPRASARWSSGARTHAS